MAQNTEVEAPKNPADQSVAPSKTAATTSTLPSETHSASEPPPSRGSRFIIESARSFLCDRCSSRAIVVRHLRLALFSKLRVY